MKKLNETPYQILAEAANDARDVIESWHRIVKSAIISSAETVDITKLYALEHSLRCLTKDFTAEIERAEAAQRHQNSNQ